MNWYAIILALYLCLLGYYYFWSGRLDEPKLDLWNKIAPFRMRTMAVDAPPTCNVDADCPQQQQDHLCIRGECIPKTLRGGICNPATGDWVVEKDGRGRLAATCVCRQPHLVTQKLKGGNCNVDLACTPHGRIADWTRLDACDCDEGYESVPGKLECRRLTSLEMHNKLPCEADEDERRNAVWYDFPRYLAHHGDKVCFKRPCTFDVLTGRSLGTRGTYDFDMGCVCDPTRGRFAVRLDSDFARLNHYNGCASIFVHEPEGEVDVEVHAYFYLLDSTNQTKPVVSFLKFNNLNAEDVNPIFREAVLQGDGSLVVEQDWPHDFMQFVLKEKKQPFTVHARECDFGMFKLYCNEWVMKDDAVIECRNLGEDMKRKDHERTNEYKLLYAYPVCHIAKDDTKVDEVYRDRYVVNPYHLLYTQSPDILRSNGLVMKRDPTTKRWLIDFNTGYNVKYFMRNNSLVPKVWTPKTTALNQDKYNLYEQDKIEVFPR